MLKEKCLRVKSYKLKATNLIFILIIIFCKGFSQQPVPPTDHQLFIDSLRPLLNRFNHLHITGYILPQYQVAQHKGVSSYEGGNFPEFVNNRFMLREARVKLEYDQPLNHRIFKEAALAFQVDATERGVGARDMYVRLAAFTEHRSYFTIGFFTRPFGNEVTYSTQLRETPERGRMSQILMPGERDLGAMMTYEPEMDNKKFHIRYDIGVFNGQGTAGPADFDSYKDIISRLALKPLDIGNELFVSGGLSLLYGGWAQGTKFKYRLYNVNTKQVFVVDSSESNIGKEVPRHYYGADVQLQKKYKWGKTELRAEYWKGIQTGSALSSTSPGSLPLTPAYIREFGGAFFYFIQSLGSPKWEAVVKFDWYDPNTRIAGKDITSAGFNPADIKYTTWVFGLDHYINGHLRLLAFYNAVRNESTFLQGYIGELKDDIFTLRMQFKF